MDGDGDGIGDFAGLARRIDYLADLGVTCLWLMPFYPTPDRDDGYDITDFYGVDPRLGNSRRPRRGDPHSARPRHAGDRRSGGQPHLRQASVVRLGSPQPNLAVPRLLRLASTSRRSEAGPWSSRARRPASGSWTSAAASTSCTVFYKHQPDLNIANPEVRDEIAKTIGFWLALGVSGFRVDAVPFLIEPPEGVEIGRPARVAARPQALPAAPGQRGRAARRGQPAVRSAARSTSAASAAGSSICSSTSCRCRRSTSRSRAATRRR